MREPCQGTRSCSYQRPSFSEGERDRLRGEREVREKPVRSEKGLEEVREMVNQYVVSRQWKSGSRAGNNGMGGTKKRAEQKQAVKGGKENAWSDGREVGSQRWEDVRHLSGHIQTGENTVITRMFILKR